MLSLFLITGCHNFGGGVRVSGHYSPGHNAPPAHAPAHGRRHHSYHYYPNAEFYFDIGRNMYFYLDSHAQWTFSVSLPIHLRHHCIITMLKLKWMMSVHIVSIDTIKLNIKNIKQNITEKISIKILKRNIRSMMTMIAEVKKVEDMNAIKFFRTLK